MIVYGRRPVEEVLSAARTEVQRLVVDRADRTRDLDCSGVQVDVDPEEVERLCGRGNHQGLAAVMKPFAYADLDKLTSAEGAILVLDQVQDPHNLGAILRSAAVLGASGVVIGKDRAASVTPTVVRTSAGLAYRIPVAQVTNIARALQTFADAGFWSVALAGEADQPVGKLDLDERTVLVVGAEGQGVRPLVRKRCDFVAQIPLCIAGSSLNASVAAGIALYEWRRQRTPA